MSRRLSASTRGRPGWGGRSFFSAVTLASDGIDAEQITTMHGVSRGSERSGHYDHYDSLAIMVMNGADDGNIRRNFGERGRRETSFF